MRIHDHEAECIIIPTDQTVPRASQHKGLVLLLLPLLLHRHSFLGFAPPDPPRLLLLKLRRPRLDLPLADLFFFLFLLLQRTFVRGPYQGLVREG